MIKPATLWGLFKSCPDSKWVGDICRSLGGQDVKLDDGQRYMVNSIKMDSDWMDERVEAIRSKWRSQKRDQRGKYDENHRTLSTVDNADKSTVRECPPPTNPSFLPSFRTNNNKEVTNSCCCTTKSKTGKTPTPSTSTTIRFVDETYGHTITKDNLGTSLSSKAQVNELIDLYTRNRKTPLDEEERAKIVDYVLTRNKAREKGIGDQPVITKENFHRTIRAWLKNLDKEQKNKVAQIKQAKATDDISKRRLAKDDDFSGED